MAGQGFERREVLRILSTAAIAAGFPGFERWAFACPQHPDDHTIIPAPGHKFRPQFFTSPEYALVETLADLIIPSDDTPGAKEAGASEFIDFMVSADPSLQPHFRYGLAWIDAHSRYHFRKPFGEIDRAQQTELLEHLAYSNKHRDAEQDGREFFALMREYTVMGFYSSRVGLQELDYPGLQMSYDKMPVGCPHTDDREHKHLTPVRN